MSEDTGVWAYAITEDEHLSGPDGELVDLSWLTGVGALPRLDVAASTPVARSVFFHTTTRHSLCSTSDAPFQRGGADKPIQSHTTASIQPPTTSVGQCAPR